MVTNHGQALPSPRRIDYGFFRLPPNGAFITLPQTRVAKRKRFGSGDAQASTSRNAEGVEVVRRGAGLENGRTNITSTSADRTYEATMVFVVPEYASLTDRNSVSYSRRLDIFIRVMSVISGAIC